jgi:hypothetical protein
MHPHCRPQDLSAGSDGGCSPFLGQRGHSVELYDAVGAMVIVGVAPVFDGHERAMQVASEIYGWIRYRSGNTCSSTVSTGDEYHRNEGRAQSCRQVVLI